jgi:predicted dehydrogenase/flavin reductase (DIM6/NTAB) family NADH-FMN oxidoreductase RutF
MLKAATDIWETRLQSVTGFLSAYDGEEIEIFSLSNFAIVSYNPPKIIVNPNALYPIDDVIRKHQFFALNIMDVQDLSLGRRMIAMRRRQAGKADILGLEMYPHKDWPVPVWKGAREYVVCELDKIIEGYDHSIMICDVRDVNNSGRTTNSRALLFRDLPQINPAVVYAMKTVSRFDVADTLKSKLRNMLGKVGSQAPNLPQNTLIQGGVTASGLRTAKSWGLKDTEMPLPPPVEPTPISARIGVCVVGTGDWGAYHCELFSKVSPYVDLFICGRNQSRAAQLARRFGAVGIFSTVDEALHDDRVSGVSIVLPHQLHGDAVRAALKAGKHILLEKPIATTLTEADELVAAEKNADVVCMVAENMHFRPSIATAAELLKIGTFGEPLHLNVRGGGMMKLHGWKGDASKMGGGIIIDFGIHYIRMLRILLGEPSRVLASCGMQSNLLMEGEDSAQLLFEGHSGWRAHFFLTWSSHLGNGPDVELYGTKASARFWAFRPYFDILGPDTSALSRLLPMLRPAFLREKIGVIREEGRTRVHLNEGDGGAAYTWEIKEFLAAIAEKRKPVSTFADARRDLEIVEAAYSSLKTHSWEEIPR